MTPIYNYEESMKSLVKATKAMHLGLAKGQNLWQQHFSRLILTSGANDTEARAGVWGSVLKDLETRLGDDTPKPSDINKGSLSQIKGVVTRDLDNAYIAKWAEGDFTVGLRAAYDALNPKAPKEAAKETAETIANWVVKKCAKHEIDIDAVVKLLASR